MKRGRPVNELNRARRREEILDVAARTFAKLGFPGTDLQVVADELGVGKGTLYRYFPSKHDLFLATVDWEMRRLLAHLDAIEAQVPDPLDQIAEGIRSYLAFFDRHPESIELLIQERGEFRDRKRPTYFQYHDANVEKWREFFRDLVRKGTIRKMRVEDVLDVLGDLLYGTIFTNHFAGRKERLEAQSRRILNVVFFGILTDRERKRFHKGEK
jgi:AcrR family transcriptional regulator